MMPADCRRLLICTHLSLTKRLGASKPLLELAESMRLLGCDVTVWGQDDLAVDVPKSVRQVMPRWFSMALKDRLAGVAGDYDVVDYDQIDLPFPRNTFAASTLMVARSSLLVRHLLDVNIPHGPSLRQRVGAILKAPQRRGEARRMASIAARTFAEADLINVSNHRDRDQLVADGVESSKVAVLPYGIGDDRRAAFDAIPDVIPAGPPTAAFIGTFDYRKGAREMPEILLRVTAAIPDLRLRLLGTNGMFEGATKVLNHFPRELRDRVDVIPSFDPRELPRLLDGSWVGIFPSYLEGFGIGVLEMLAAAIPVAAYDAPGPSDFLPANWLVPTGNAAAMASRIVGWLTDRSQLAADRRAARARAADYGWPAIARRTAQLYASQVARLRSVMPIGRRNF